MSNFKDKTIEFPTIEINNKPKVNFIERVNKYCEKRNNGHKMRFCKNYQKVLLKHCSI